MKKAKFPINSVFDDANMPSEINNNMIYQYYKTRLQNLFMSRFEWTLPDTCNEWFLEDTFMRQGTATFLQEEYTGDWMSLGYTFNGTLNVYGLPTDIRGMGYCGNTSFDANRTVYNQIKPKDSNFVIGFDNADRKIPMTTINLFAYLLWEVHMTYRSNLTQQNTPYLITVPNKNILLSIKNIMLQIFAKNRVIELTDPNVKLEEIINVLDLRVDFKGKELLETLDIIWNMGLAMLGLMNGTEKKERMIKVETDMNQWENLTVLGGTLKEREKMLDQAIKLGMPGNPDVTIRKIPFEELVSYPAQQMMYAPMDYNTMETVDKEGESNG